jgi:hypothetical protein
VQVRTATATVEREYDTHDISRVWVDTEDDVSVEPADGEHFRVRGHKRTHGNTDLDELAIRSRVNGDTLRLASRKPDVVGIGGGSIDLEVFVPESVEVDRVRTDEGSVSLRGVSGDATAETDDGDIAASDVAGDLDASTDDAFPSNRSASNNRRSPRLHSGRAPRGSRAVRSRTRVPRPRRRRPAIRVHRSRPGSTASTARPSPRRRAVPVSSQ